MKNNYNSTISLRCITCGGAGFDFNNDKTYVKCETCGREYLGGYDELVKFNEANIQREVNKKAEEIKKDFVKDLQKAFNGSKYFKIS